MQIVKNAVAEAPPAVPPGRMAQSGICYITIGVRDLPAVIQEIEAKGLSFAVPLREVRSGVSIAVIDDRAGDTVERLETSE